MAARYWLPALMVLLTAVVAIAYRQSLSGMLTLWSLTTYQHAWLVFPVTLYLLWDRREAMAGIEPAPFWPALVAVAALVLVWGVASRVGIQVIEHLSMTLMIPAAVWAVAGNEATRRALFPLLFVVAAVPVGESWIPFLMRGTAEISTWLLYVAGVPAYRQGMFISLPGGEFEVADVCSGLRYILAGALTALLFSYFSYRHVFKRVLFVAVAIVSFVLVNGLRAFIVMFVASSTDREYLSGRDHVIFGMILFALLMLILVLAGRRYADEEEPAVAAGGADIASITTIQVAAASIVTVLLLGSGPPLQRAAGPAAPGPAATLKLPEIRDCTAPSAWQPDWSPLLLGPDATSAASFECGEHRVSLFVARYVSQRQGKELISTQNVIWPRDWRRTAEVSVAEVELDGRITTVHRVHMPGGEPPTMLWYWYRVGDRVTSSQFAVKLIETANALTLRSPASSLYLVSVEGDDAAPGLEQTLARVAVELIR